MLKKLLSKVLPAIALSTIMVVSATVPHMEASAANVSGKNYMARKKKANAKTIMFKDSLGRKVNLPKKITRVAPSGSLSHFILYTLCPDKLVSSGKGFSKKADGFIPNKYMKLPRTGSLYGRKATILPEEIIKLKPQVAIDIGEIKGSVSEMSKELDRFQKTVGIPTVMIEANISKSLPDAYRTLGKILGEEKKAEELAEFCEKVMNRADRNASKIPSSKKVKVYWATGEDGLQTEVKGKMHAMPFDKVGAINVANFPAQSNSAKTVSMEQLLVWKPDVIIAESAQLAEKIKNDNLWKILPAVKNNRVYVVPDRPYCFMAYPSSANQILGVIWLGNVLYPEYNKYDMREEIVEFYDLFYHVDIGESQLNSILSGK